MAEFAFQYYILPEQILLGTKPVQNDGKLTWLKQDISTKHQRAFVIMISCPLKPIIKYHSFGFRSPVQSVEKILLSVMSMIAEPNINR